MGTDESSFIHILTNRPDAHLRAVFQQYQQRHGKKFTKVIKKEFSGWIKTALCYLGKMSKPPHSSHEIVNVGTKLEAIEITDTCL